MQDRLFQEQKKIDDMIKKFIDTYSKEIAYSTISSRECGIVVALSPDINDEIADQFRTNLLKLLRQTLPEANRNHCAAGQDLPTNTIYLDFSNDDKIVKNAINHLSKSFFSHKAEYLRTVDEKLAEGGLPKEISEEVFKSAGLKGLKK